MSTRHMGIIAHTLRRKRDTMLYWLTDGSDKILVFNVFRYLTIRAGGALVTALVFMVLFGPSMINLLLGNRGENQAIRSDDLSSQTIVKVATLTMVGVTLVLSALASTLVWANPLSPYIWIVLGVTISFGLIGFCDDYMRMTEHGHSGLTTHTQVLIETLIAATAWIAIVQNGRAPLTTSLVFPFFRGLVLDLGWFSLPFSAFIIVATANMVKRTGGLRWPLIVVAMIAAAGFGANAYLTGNVVFANDLQIQYVAGTGELAVLCAALVGASLGCLRFRPPRPPLFIGDASSLALGAMLGTLAVATKQEFVFAVFGALFVLLGI
jgi:phospho-N-acetylmuramoyl-pentapeptide-transferase